VEVDNDEIQTCMQALSITNRKQNKE